MVVEKTKGSSIQKNESIVDSLNTDITKIGNDMKYSAGIQLVYTGLLMSRYADLVLSRFNLNVPRITLLFTLILHGGALKPKDLSKLLFRSKQNISVVIDGLLKSGLVSKQLDPKDRRSFKIVITRKGLELARASLPIFLDVFTSSLSVVDEKKLHDFKATMRTIRKSLYKHLEDFASGKNHPDN
jgi:DNA-binding MarR family transcriptional regulator